MIFLLNKKDRIAGIASIGLQNWLLGTNKGCVSQEVHLFLCRWRRIGNRGGLAVFKKAKAMGINSGKKKG